ncbi:ferrochelatase [Rheinheimera riviphila]|uniref:Ferrochelatase n=1 Tax=Rheinheimera riviphila TaxID=1834037 RepID=A0A437R194_9GAMM|nr:ferrochelatase [Rheinheimera riviphila]RVU40518.1 ferrochelatase [Rheinheimera riviphila]
MTPTLTLPLQRYAVVLVNLGTPDEPTVPAIQRYLQQFLSDQRVVDYPAILWQCILRGIILPFRGRRVAKLYQSIWWDEGSPLRVITQRQTKALGNAMLMGGLPVQVRYAMTYGNPSIASVLDELRAQGVERFLVLPLYPQYSATTTAAISDQISSYLQQQRDLPEIRMQKHYHHLPAYRSALAGSVRAHWAKQGQADALLLSFHGIPERFVRLGDPYERHCRETAANLATDLGLTAEQVLVSFQSRVGKEQWLQPYTDQLLEKLPGQGIKKLQVLCPAFSADCLETLEEIAVENCEVFLHAGGEDYQYIKALNDSPCHIQLFRQLVLQQLQGW